MPVTMACSPAWLLLQLLCSWGSPGSKPPPVPVKAEGPWTEHLPPPALVPAPTSQGDFEADGCLCQAQTQESAWERLGPGSQGKEMETRTPGDPEGSPVMLEGVGVPPAQAHDRI